MPDFKQFASVALIATLFLPATPARANPALVAAPAICATGVGCILIGTAIVGGIAYYVWQNSRTGEQYHVPIEDPEEESDSMGRNAQQGRVVRAGSASEAHTICSGWADGRRVGTPTNLGNGRWRCNYY
ncbi:MAG: hypothetical protein HC879_20590 [Leptolyngbyaceae cyanobacterium SL_5_9]|nr:hypothetical protein [Leptolyngbyaceae cyanobacterium SL_5_9]NJO75071.1 hypothetical protein [Leptolyngbyaceae cyanobacterium RM1_406_9]